MIDINKKYCTRDGREVRIYAVDGGGVHCVHGAVKNAEGWAMCSWVQNGPETPLEGHYDLVELKPRIKRTLWAQLYPNNVTCFSSEDGAVGQDCLAKIKVEIDVEEGHGL